MAGEFGKYLKPVCLHWKRSSVLSVTNYETWKARNKNGRSQGRNASRNLVRPCVDAKAQIIRKNGSFWIHLKFLKYLFNLKKSTPTYMIYGELGIVPITVEIQSRVLNFWCNLLKVMKIQNCHLCSTKLFILCMVNGKLNQNGYQM